jgi:hypothetical protein
VVGCCECGDEPSGTGATDLVIYIRTLHIIPSKTRRLQFMHSSVNEPTTYLRRHYRHQREGDEI